MDNRLTDSINDTNLSIMDKAIPVFFNKAQKLITALYMVTDIMDKEEPIRQKLRMLGTEIISDINSNPIGASSKIVTTLSFLSIASTMNFISEMNCGILKKEFSELNMCIHEYQEVKPSLVSEILSPELKEDSISRTSKFKHLATEDNLGRSIGQTKSSPKLLRTSVGVQKGSTLLKALSDINTISNTKNSLDVFKQQRQAHIINIIKDSGGSATIKDIKSKIETVALGVFACSEKTLQRELAVMVKNNVLDRVGEKRWSKYLARS